VERHLSGDQTFRQWTQDPELLGKERGDRLEIQPVLTEKVETVKLKNVVPPIHFQSGVAKIPPEYVAKIAQVLESMRYRENVRVPLRGHADNERLSPALKEVFGDNAGLSRERAGEVAEYFKKSLGLPPEAITYEWMGDTQPVASNDSEAGRAKPPGGGGGLVRRAPGAVKDQEVVVREDLKRIKVCRMETVCKLSYKEGAGAGAPG
jgi:outer membrane protein OmpA-like peptidoglycan-associated protein